eukprot:gnl/MRDRNA2_/MRDRNA2_27885_c0_seq1.p1 gnl/MRDRNA2_/MRDRNA2_27885_c0~~gnl/MRDRNA2_/MRDRNA2_27885_c0_seq1.p1  ORF type:complete len:362 (+),score=68.24 gnl/MRDRNA2_/MRDRNA2_27885_c0_seq1:79-1086(+)
MEVSGCRCKLTFGMAAGAAGLSLGAYLWQQKGGILTMYLNDLITAAARAIVERAKEDEEKRNASSLSDASQANPKRQREFNKIPPRPVHYVIRPQSDPRIDKALYARYDPAPDCKTGAIIIVIPGGNYDESGVNGHEAQTVAQWLTRLGITAIVLQYRCVSEGHYWPAQFEDWTDCAKAVKAQAEGWGCDPDRIGVIGFSAGGHLAAYAALKAGLDIQPKLQVLIYPAIDALSPRESLSMDPWHADEGYPPIEDSIHLLECSAAPPTFMAGIAADDLTPAKENTDPYAQLLQDSGVPCKYIRNEDDDEQHGCGMKDWWTEACEEWLAQYGWATPI